MPIARRTALALLVFTALALGGCASLQPRQAIEAIVVAVEPLKGESLELRMLVKLRIQNPNELPLDYNGVSLEMDVQGKRFATGVSNATGSVPRFGETIIEVPVSLSAFRMARQALGVISAETRGKLRYEISGRLAGSGFGGMRFQSAGEFTLPSEFATPEP